VIDKFLISLNEFLKKNLLPSIMVSLLAGCGVGFFIAGKRTSSGCVLAVNTTSGSEVSDGSIVVDLSGAVSKPGVYKLNVGSRVGDLLDVGGGVLGDVSKTWISKSLNLSKKLDDSTKVYIPFEWEITSQGTNEVVKTVASSTSSSSGSSSQSSSEEDTSNTGIGDDGKTNVNTASSSDLDKLTGIGPAYAEKIITGRPYADMADFESRSGLWASTISGIKNLITF
jgi:competence protein ComEA